MLVILEVHLLLVLDELVILSDFYILGVVGFGPNVKVWGDQKLLLFFRNGLNRFSHISIVHILLKLLFKLLATR